MTRPDEKRLLGSGFPGDDGSLDPGLGSALAAFGAGTGSYAAALAALLDARVLVPVVAVLGEVEYSEAEYSEVEYGEGPVGSGPNGTALAQDKSSDMATVLLTGADGRRALLAFTSTGSMRAWQADARPVPVGFRDAALAAVHEGADALLVDVAGPVPFPVEGDDLRAAAAGYRLAFVGDSSAWVPNG